MMMDHMTEDLWRQRVNKENPKALWGELKKDYQKAGVPELSKELAKFTDMTHSNYPEAQAFSVPSNATPEDRGDHKGVRLPSQIPFLEVYL